VKKLILCTALMATFPAMAAAVPESAEAAPAKPQSAMAAAVEAAATELEQNFGSAKGNPLPILDKLAVYEFTAPTAEKLKKVFGSARPFTLVRTPAAGAMNKVDFSIAARNYADVNEQNWSWSAINLTMLIDEAGRNATSNGSWPALVVDSKQTKIVFNDMSLESKQTRTSDDVWVGKARADIKLADITDKEKAISVKMENLSVTSQVEQNGKDYDIGSDFGIKLITVMDEKIDDVRMSMRMSKIDLKSFEQISNSIKQKTKPGETPQLDDIGPQIKAFAKGMAARGSSIELSELSVAYLGHRAIVKGHFKLGKIADKDLSSGAAFAKKMDAHLEVRVPVALVTAIARKMTVSQAAKKGETQTPEVVEATAKNLTDMAVDKATGDGYARLDDGVLVSLVDYKAGKLTVNGKAISLPGAGGKQPAAGGKKAAAGGKKPARRNK
jgi:uncharacterized protein YdgA (DUF945 family)